MITLTANQIIALGSSLLDLREKQNLSDEALDYMRVRISDPRPDGGLEFDVFLPPVFRFPSD